MRDGLLGKCKDCTKSDSTKRRWSNLESVREYDRNRPNKNERVTKGLVRQRKARRTRRGKAKLKAYSAVSRAIAKGRLVREPCAICRASNTEAHHHDYTRPLDVVWLCPVHHRQLHAGRVLPPFLAMRAKGFQIHFSGQPGTISFKFDPPIPFPAKDGEEPMTWERRRGAQAALRRYDKACMALRGSLAEDAPAARELLSISPNSVTIVSLRELAKREREAAKRAKKK